MKATRASPPRIVLALDVSSVNLVSLETSVRIASRMRAGLDVLVVQDEALASFTALPATNEVSWVFSPRTFDAASASRMLRAREGRLESDLRALGAFHGVRIAVHTAIGRYLPRVLREAETSTFLMLGSPPHPTRRDLVPTQTLGRERRASGAVVVFDDSAAGGEALEAAAELTAHLSIPLEIWLPINGIRPASRREQAREWARERLGARLEGRGATGLLRLRSVPIEMLGRTLSALGPGRCRLLVLHRHQRFAGLGAAADILGRLAVPVVLVAGPGDASDET